MRSRNEWNEGMQLHPTATVEVKVSHSHGSSDHSGRALGQLQNDLPRYRGSWLLSTLAEEEDIHPFLSSEYREPLLHPVGELVRAKCWKMGWRIMHVTFPRKEVKWSPCSSCGRLCPGSKSCSLYLQSVISGGKLGKPWTLCPCAKMLRREGGLPQGLPIACLSLCFVSPLPALSPKVKSLQGNSLCKKPGLDLRGTL